MPFNTRKRSQPYPRKPALRFSWWIAAAGLHCFAKRTASCGVCHNSEIHYYHCENSSTVTAEASHDKGDYTKIVGKSPNWQFALISLYDHRSPVFYAPRWAKHKLVISRQRSCSKDATFVKLTPEKMTVSSMLEEGASAAVKGMKEEAVVDKITPTASSTQRIKRKRKWAIAIWSPL